MKTSPSRYTHLDDGTVQALLTTHRENLAELMQQAAKTGIQVPMNIASEIRQEEHNIAAIQAELAQRKQQVPAAKRLTTAIKEGPSPSWSQIIAALITAGALILVTWIGIRQTGTETLTSTNKPPFVYRVHVQTQDTAQGLTNAHVILETTGQAPLDEYTDSNGFASIQLNEQYLGKPGRITVDAPGYSSFHQNIDLNAEALPDRVLLRTK